MTRERIIDFLQQTGALLVRAKQAQQNINEGRATKLLIDALGRAEQALQLAAQLKDVQAQADQITEVIVAKTRVSSIEAAETLSADITARLEMADAAFIDWRRALAAHEINIRTGVYVEPEARAASEATIADIKERYTTALEMASDTVPASGVVLL